MKTYALHQLDDYIAHFEQEAIGVYPFDTVLGLTGIATPRVFELLMEAKQRDKSQPFLILVPDLETLLSTVEIPPGYLPFVRQCSPGPVTYIFNKKKTALPFLDPYLPASDTGVSLGVRVPDAPALSQLLLRLQHPIFSTSANVSGQAQVSSANALPSSLRDLLTFNISDDTSDVSTTAFGLDGDTRADSCATPGSGSVSGSGFRGASGSGSGATPSSGSDLGSRGTSGSLPLPSTLVNCLGEKPVIVRHGASAADVEKAIASYG